MCKTAAFVIVKGVRNGIVFHGAARGQASVSIQRDAAKTRMTDSISPRRTAVFVRPGESPVGSEPPDKGETPTNGFFRPARKSSRDSRGKPERRMSAWHSTGAGQAKGRIAARPCAKARIGSSPGATRPGRHPTRRPPRAKRAPPSKATRRMDVSNDGPARKGRSKTRRDKPERSALCAWRASGWMPSGARSPWAAADPCFRTRSRRYPSFRLTRAGRVPGTHPSLRFSATVPAALASGPEKAVRGRFPFVWWLAPDRAFTWPDEHRRSPG